ncbi:hypothetical protein SAY86_006282 [Trapa natans]|uniref:Uncharacterized protein n=1 Tax=Trapa natans TaxID=22666 RepID=A0AAN7L711_TRANT|nr:hypothetical protein SAY86_006282 [Trapa natans]
MLDRFWGRKWARKDFSTVAARFSGLRGPADVLIHDRLCCSMDPPSAHTAPELEEDEWDNDGFVIPSLEIDGADPAEQDAPNLQTSVATSQMQAPQKLRFKQKMKEADKKFGGSGRENKVENLRELVGGGSTRLPSPTMTKGSPRDWLDPHCHESQFQKRH